MNHEDIEQKLRKLKPTEPQVSLRFTCGSLSRRQYRWYRFALPVAVAASLLVLVYFISEPQSEDCDLAQERSGVSPPVESVLVETHRGANATPFFDEPRFSTVRQLYAEMVKEIQPTTIENSIEYAVIKLTVADGRGVRRQETGNRHNGIFHSRSEVIFDL